MKLITTYRNVTHIDTRLVQVAGHSTTLLTMFCGALLAPRVCVSHEVTIDENVPDESLCVACLENYKQDRTATKYAYALASLWKETKCR